MGIMTNEWRLALYSSMGILYFPKKYKDEKGGNFFLALSLDGSTCCLYSLICF